MQIQTHDSTSLTINGANDTLELFKKAKQLFKGCHPSDYHVHLATLEHISTTSGVIYYKQFPSHMEHHYNRVFGYKDGVLFLSDTGNLLIKKTTGTPYQPCALTKLSDSSLYITTPPNTFGDTFDFLKQIRAKIEVKEKLTDTIEVPIENKIVLDNFINDLCR